MSLTAIDLSVPLHCLDVASGLSSHSSLSSSAESSSDDTVTCPPVAADFIIVGGGGGPGSTGLVNKLGCLDWDKSGTNLIQSTDITFGKDEDAPWSIAVMFDGSLICAGVNASISTPVNRNCRILSRTKNGVLKETKSFITTSPSLGSSDFQCAASFSRNGKWLATGSDAGTLSVFNTSEFIQLDWAPLSLGSKIFNLCFTSDSTQVIVTSEKSVQVYKVDSGELLLDIKPPTGHTFRAGRLGNGSLFYTVINFKREKCLLSIWNLEHPDKPIKTMTAAHKSAVSFNIRDEIAVIGLNDCSFIVLRSLSQVAIYRKAHDVPITSMGIIKSPHGKIHIVSVSGDGFIKLWPIPLPSKMYTLVRTAVQSPFTIALFALILVIWVTWFILGLVAPTEQLVHLGIPFLTVQEGRIRLVAMHVPWLKSLGIAQILG